MNPRRSFATIATIGATVAFRRGSGAPLVGAAGAPVAHDGSRVLYRDGYIGPPMQDTCDARCGFKSYPTGEFQYLDPSCEKDPFGCGLGGQKDCRICQMKMPDYHGRPTKWRYPQCPTCVCHMHEVDPLRCDVCVSEYKYFRFNIKTTRFKDGYTRDLQCQTYITQFSEIKLYTDGGARELELDASKTVVLTGEQCRADQGPAAATDGSLLTKFCDFHSIDEAEGINFAFGLHEPSRLSHYEFFTAEDCHGRDPTSWTLYGSTVGTDGPWVALNSDRQEPPEGRMASYGKRVLC